MDDSHAEVFIVDHDKKILWSAIPESYNKVQKKWFAEPSYRASIVTDKNELERLIWNTGYAGENQ